MCFISRLKFPSKSNLRIPIQVSLAVFHFLNCYVGVKLNSQTERVNLILQIFLNPYRSSASSKFMDYEILNFLITSGPSAVVEPKKPELSKI